MAQGRQIRFVGYKDVLLLIARRRLRAAGFYIGSGATTRWRAWKTERFTKPVE
ncbi:MAG TPA: hypothetical protein VJH03_16985 [Blastocatellia bacterium]|nr:hypothetical protein [Blastocatellia bacterium]